MALQDDASAADPRKTVLAMLGSDDPADVRHALALLRALDGDRGYPQGFRLRDHMLAVEQLSDLVRRVERSFRLFALLTLARQSGFLEDVDVLDATGYVLRESTVTSASSDVPPTVLEALADLPKLQSLHARGFRLDLSPVRTLPALNSLELDALEPRDVGALLVPRLERLSIRHCGMDHVRALAQMAWLRKLRIIGEAIDCPRDLLAHLPSTLRSLSLFLGASQVARPLDGIAHLRELEALEISMDPAATFGELRALSCLRVLAIHSPLASLRDVDALRTVEDLSFVCTEDFDDFDRLAALPKLRSLTIDGAPRPVPNSTLERLAHVRIVMTSPRFKSRDATRTR